MERKNKSFPKKTAQESKILNADTTTDVFINVCCAFIQILKELTINDRCELVIQKLLEVQDLLQKRIQLLMPSVENINSTNDIKMENFDMPKSLATSMQSIFSEVSNSEISISNDSSYKNFKTIVHCPFCFKEQPNQIKLIDHFDESCLPLANKTFGKRTGSDYSAFQILPNNFFKCNVCINSVHQNIKQYYIHMKSDIHLLKYAKSSKNKMYTDLLFCSCCKVKVPNNYTEIDLHINHKVHKKRGQYTLNFKNLVEQKIHSVYTKTKKFKCLICPSRACFASPTEIFQHFEEKSHIYKSHNKSPFAPTVYCEFCAKKIHLFDLMEHLTWENHTSKEEMAEESYELCLFCGFKSETSEELSTHMLSKCYKIKEIRKRKFKSQQPATEDFEIINRSSEEEDEVPDAMGERRIIVKGSADKPEVCRHLKKFGEISSVKALCNKDLMVTFESESAVKDILLVRDLISFDGVKLEICKCSKEMEEAIEKEGKQKVKIEVKEKNVSENECAKVLYAPSRNETNVSSNSNSGSLSRESHKVINDNLLEELFERVSHHLLKTTERLDSDVQKKIASDCGNDLKLKKSEFVGFSGCQLSFPVENVNLFYEINSSRYSDASVYFDRNTIRTHFIKICDSRLWADVKTSLENPFPLITLKHKETQKKCTITFVPSTKLITDMLNDCLESEVARSCCLIIRFWLSVHEIQLRHSEYTVMSLLVFFLISENIVQLSVEKYSNCKTSVLRNADQWSLGKPSPKVPGFMNVKVLFQKFLNFLINFNFDLYSICLPVPYPVPKTYFMKDWGKILCNSLCLKESLKSPLLIIDPLLYVNVASDVTKENLRALLEVAKDTVEHHEPK